MTKVRRDKEAAFREADRLVSKLERHKGSKAVQEVSTRKVSFGD